MCEIEISNIGKNKGNPDLVCEKIIEHYHYNTPPYRFRYKTVILWLQNQSQHGIPNNLTSVDSGQASAASF